GAALPANDLTAYLEQVSSTIETQLQLTRTGHQAGAEVQPFVDQLSAALESVSNLAPNELGQQVAVSLAREIGKAIGIALSGLRPVDGCCSFANTIADEAYRKYAKAACPSVGFIIKPAEADLSWHGVLSKVSGTTTLEERPAKTDVELILS